MDKFQTIIEDLYKFDIDAYDALHKFFENRGLNIPVGRKVIMTCWAISNGLSRHNKQIEGRLVGRGIRTKIIKVIKDGNKTASSYWPGFWKSKYPPIK